MNRSIVAAALVAALSACGGQGSGSPPANGSAGTAGVSNGAAGSSSGGSSGANAGAAGNSTAGLPELALPIEVLGSGAPDEPVVVGTSLPLANADLSAAAQLYVQCHRCGFYDAPGFEALSKPLTKAKASLRVLGGASDAPWVDVTDASVQLDEVSRAHGGLNGGLVSVSFTLALDESTRSRLVAGNNALEFRFNGTDGNANGFRVLHVQLRDASGKNLSLVNERWADIALEKEAGKAASEAATQGRALWYALDSLAESPLVPRKIRAACSSCHAADGRDLQYFNYSDHSIVQRSRFHGLSAEQGQQIAAFLRSSLHDEVPHVAAAAPWNPPYQPGPGLDSKPLAEWAAGAGLDAVLPDGKAFLSAFVGKAATDVSAVTQAELDAVMDPSKVLNTREMPVPLQFPDWNSWLPPISPLDIWTPEAGQTEGLFETQGGDNNPNKVVARIEQWLETNKNPNGVYGDWTHLTADQHVQISNMIGYFGSKVVDVGGGSRGTRVSPDPSKPFGAELGAAKLQARASAETKALYPAASFSKEGFIERVNFSLYRWMGIKQWEMVHTYGAESQLDFHGHKDASGKWVGEGEKRGWPYSWPSMFYVAPHMLYATEQTSAGKREFYYSWEPRLDSYYRTNQWYQLQVSINPGWAGASNGAMDWPYHMGFTNAVVDDLNKSKAPDWVSAAHLARYFQIRTKLAQLANTDISFDTPKPEDPTNLFANTGMQSKADLLFKLSPTAVMDNGPAGNEQTRYRALESIGAGTHLLFVNGNFALYNALYASTEPAKYRRCDPSNTSLGGPEPKSGFRFCIDSALAPFETNADGKPHLPGSVDNWTTAQYLAWGKYQGTNMGVESKRLETYSAWLAKLWQ